MSTAPLVSVILPVFNGCQYLPAALASVASQSISDLDIIVVDDGSTHDSASAARSLAGARVRVVRQAHAGAAAARNRGIALAKAGWLAFLDSDDVWAPDKLAWQVAALRREPALDMVFGHYAAFAMGEPDGKPQPGYCSGTLLVRREAFMRAGLFATEWRLGEFVEWYARAVDAGLTSRMLPQVVLRRRVHATNSTRQAREAWTDYARVAHAIWARRRGRPGTMGEQAGPDPARQA